MSHINEYIKDYMPKDYGGAELPACELDCSLGVNSEAIPQEVLDALKGLISDDVKNYPHGGPMLSEIYKYIIQRYNKGLPKEDQITEDNIHIGCGSFDLLCNLNLLYANKDKTILGHAPQFTAYVDYVQYIGATYEVYNLNREKNYKFEAERYIDKMLEVRPNLAICENPNNPTGQAIEKKDIEKIIEAAGKVEAAMIFDEAYGDYLNTQNYSAVAYVKAAERAGTDLYVTRSFSKGYGMAAIRMGYVIGPKRGIDQLKKLVTPFNCNILARHMVLAMLKREPDYTEDLDKRTASGNRRLYESIRADGKFKIAETSLHTPICTLYVDDPQVDLCMHLAKFGIATVSCAGYDNMGQNMVRLKICEDVDRLIELLKKAGEKL